MRAKDVMTSPFVTVGPDATVQEIATLLIERRVSGVPVLDQGERVVGIVSEGDLLRRVEHADERHRSWWLRLLSDPATDAAEYVKTHGRRAADVMTRDVVTVGVDTPLHEIAALLEERRIKRVPVVQDGRLVGIVSRANLLHGLAAWPVAAPAPTIDDQAIRATILTTLRVEVGGMTKFVNVVVSQGVVDLWGATDSSEVKRAIRVAAENAPGVREVRDRVGILPYMVRRPSDAERPTISPANHRSIGFGGFVRYGSLRDPCCAAAISRSRRRLA
jgi:CBS-domain-containing membrane protein